jgi:hypothetical protein
MSRPTVHAFVRLALFVAAVATAACANPTAPNAPLNQKKQAVRDSVPEGDTLEMGTCRSGWTVANGRYVCDFRG